MKLKLSYNYRLKSVKELSGRRFAELSFGFIPTTTGKNLQIKILITVSITFCLCQLDYTAENI